MHPGSLDFPKTFTFGLAPALLVFALVVSAGKVEAREGGMTGGGGGNDVFQDIVSVRNYIEDHCHLWQHLSPDVVAQIKELLARKGNGRVLIHTKRDVTCGHNDKPRSACTRKVDPNKAADSDERETPARPKSSRHGHGG